jgi:Rap1a immunity proteins
MNRRLALLSMLALPAQAPALMPIDAAIAPLTAPAQPTMYVTGQSLVKSCSEVEKALNGLVYDTAGAIECTSYLTGALDQQTRLESAQGMSPTICVPTTVTKGHLAEVFLSYARAKPDAQDAVATDLIAAALGDAYPCASKLTGP